MNWLLIIFIILILLLLWWIYDNNKQKDVLILQDNRPPAPTGLNSVFLDNNHVIVSWNSIPGVSHYLLTANNTRVNNMNNAMTLSENRKHMVYDNSIELGLPPGTWYIQVAATYGSDCYGDISEPIVINNTPYILQK